MIPVLGLITYPALNPSIISSYHICILQRINMSYLMITRKVIQGLGYITTQKKQSDT